MEHATVSEIHRYPLRPEGFEEPLFATRGSRRAVAEHLLRAPWLVRASELAVGGAPGERAGRRTREPVRVVRRGDGRAYLIRRCRGGRARRKDRVTRVLERWREVGRWWDEEARVDRSVFRVELGGGAVVDLALERSSGGCRWSLVGLVD